MPLTLTMEPGTTMRQGGAGTTETITPTTAITQTGPGEGTGEVGEGGIETEEADGAEMEGVVDETEIMTNNLTSFPLIMAFGL